MRRLLVALLVGVGAICLVILGSARPSAAQGTLTGLGWSFSSLAPSAASEVTVTFNTATTATLKSVTMTMPDGMTGMPSLVSWTAQSSSTTKNVATSVTGTSLSDASPPVLTVTLSTSVPAASFNTIVVDGLTNPPSPETATSTIETNNNAGLVDEGTTQAIVLNASSLASCYTTQSATGTSATGVSATFDESTASTADLTAFTFDVPPGTSGTPSVTSVSPSSLEGGTASLDVTGTVLTYTLASATSVAADTPIVLTIGSLTEPGAIGSFVGEAVTVASGTAVDACELPSMTITADELSALSWSSTSNTTGANASYTFGFTTPVQVNLDEITLSVPPGTSGASPTLAGDTLQESPTLTKTLASPSVTLNGTVLDLTFTKLSVPAGTVVTLTFSGLTNTANAGAFSSSVVGITPTQPIGPAYSGTTSPVVNFTSAALTALSWSVDSTAVGESDVTYNYGFQLTAAAALDTITISLPPGTAGSPTLGGVSPSAISGGTLTVGSDTATYQFSSTTIDPSTEISIELDGVTNTATAGTYAASVTVSNAGEVVASGTTTSVTFTANTLTNLSWSVAPTTTSATNASYTFGFTAASTSSLTSYAMTVPSGTAGTPALGSTSVVNGGSTITLKGTATETLSGTTLTLSYSSSTSVPSGSVVSLQFTGLTNTTQAGSYTSSVTTYDKSAAVDAGTTPAVAFSSSSLASPTWSVSTTAIGATGVAYTYGFGVSVGSPIDTVTMTVPSDTAGSPSVGPITPSSIAGGSVNLSGGLLTYTLPAETTLSDNTTVSIEIDGLTNTSSAGSPTSTLTVLDDGTSIASGATPPVSFTATVLSALSWSSASSVTGATGVTYTYGFTTATQTSLNGVSITLPPGTGGSPTLASDNLDEPGNGNKTLTGTSVNLNGSTMVLSFTSVSPPSGTAFTLAFSEITNTATPGSYAASVATLYRSATVDTGTTPSLAFYAASVVLSSPAGIGWSAQLTGQNLQLVDEASGDESYLVDDATGTDDGWNVTVSATPFTDGGRSLSSALFSTNGSLSNAGSTAAPTATCISSCGAFPTNSVTYPVTIPSDGSSQAVIYKASAGTGSGSFAIGGSSATNPVGWWLAVPGNAIAGSYSSTVTFSVSSGP